MPPRKEYEHDPEQPQIHEPPHPLSPETRIAAIEEAAAQRAIMNPLQGVPMEAAVASYSPPRSSRVLVATVIFAVLSTVGGGAFAFSWWRAQNDPEAIYGAMLEKSMTVNTFTQTHDLSLKDAQGKDYAKIITILESDFSDISDPKMRAEVNVDAQFFDKTITREGEQIGLGAGKNYFKLTRAAGYLVDNQPGILADISLKELENIWIHGDSTTNAQLFATTLFFMPVQVQDLNTVRGELTIGNVPQPLRDELLLFLREEKPATIISSEMTELDGQKVAKYELRIDQEKMKAYNNKLPSHEQTLLGADLEESGLGGDSGYADGYTLYVDARTKLPMRVVAEEENARVTITYSEFNEPLEIEAPVDAISSQEALRLYGLDF